MAAVTGARADVVPVDVDECSTSCVYPTSDDEAASAGDVTLSLSGGGGAGDPTGLRPDLIFDSRALPSVLVSGLPSPIMSVGARALDDPDVSPYRFSGGVLAVRTPPTRGHSRQSPSPPRSRASSATFCGPATT